MFLIRNITLWLILFFFAWGGVFISFSSFNYYKDLKENTLSIRKSEIKNISFYTKEELVGKKDISPFLKNFYENTDSGEISFFRALNLEDKRIFASNKKEDVGAFYDDWLKFEEESVFIQEHKTREKENLISLTYKNGDYALWLGIENNYFLKNLVAYIIKQALIFFLALVVLLYFLYYIETRYLLKPMRDLRDTILELGSEKFSYSKKELGESFGELLASFTDMTKDVKNILKNEKELSEMKSDFIATTAHQLRTPLSGINWALESLEKDPKNNLTDMQKTIIDRASQKNKELIKMIQELLATSNIEKGQFSYHYEEIDLLKIVKKEVEEIKHKAKEKEIVLTFQEPENDISNVRADADRIQWVIQNIIENAIRYTQETGEIKVSIKKESGKILISVEDNGMGIEEKDKEKIFEKFYRSKRAIQKHNAGNGLGLYIAKKIVEQHGGEMWFETSVGEGTTFYFTIPLNS